MEFPLNSSFVNRIKKDSFFDNQLIQALDSKPPISIRKNDKKNCTNFENELAIPWCSNAFHLSERPLFTLDPLFHTGSYYPQEAGSMLLEFVLKSINLSEHPRVLDLCAAPGGKSTLIASFLNNNGMLVSNEVINSRSKILRENMTKWGYSNCIVTNNDPSNFSATPHFFDVIVVDAPCSGEGMFRKDHSARTEWNEDNVTLCAARQKRILGDIWQSLKPTGYLIYSTCTFNSSENEENIEWLIQEFNAELIQIEIPPSFTKGRNGIGIYGIPGVSETEGFFIAVVRKPDEQPIKRAKSKRPNQLSIQKDLLDATKFANLDNTTIYNWQNNLLAIPSTLIDDFLFIQEQLHIVKFGTNLGEIARKGLIPNHELAMNFSLRKLNFMYKLERQEALNYLHGDTFIINKNHGFQLVSFQDEPLGWVKNLGNRFNNLYPKELRIRMDVR